MSSSGRLSPESRVGEDISGRVYNFDPKSRDVCDSAHAARDRLYSLGVSDRTFSVNAESSHIDRYKG
jgi:hypothetical protein